MDSHHLRGLFLCLLSFCQREQRGPLKFLASGEPGSQLRGGPEHAQVKRVKGGEVGSGSRGAGKPGNKGLGILGRCVLPEGHQHGGGASVKTVSVGEWTVKRESGGRWV